MEGLGSRERFPIGQRRRVDAAAEGHSTVPSEEGSAEAGRAERRGAESGWLSAELIMPNRQQIPLSDFVDEFNAD